MLLLTLDHRKKRNTHILRYLERTKLMCLLVSFFREYLRVSYYVLFMMQRIFFHDNGFFRNEHKKHPFRTRYGKQRGKLFFILLGKGKHFIKIKKCSTFICMTLLGYENSFKCSEFSIYCYCCDSCVQSDFNLSIHYLKSLFHSTNC